MQSKTRLSDRLALLVAQWFGCGLSPRAPGTAGSLGALPLFWLLSALSPSAYWLSTLLLTGAGFWSSQRVAVLLDEKDPSSVVVDEVAGVLIALGMVASEPPWVWALAWILFRLLDIKKPWLIDRVQYLRPAAVGIMADDLLAGGVAGALAWLTSALL